YKVNIMNDKIEDDAACRVLVPISCAPRMRSRTSCMYNTYISDDTGFKFIIQIHIIWEEANDMTDKQTDTVFLASINHFLRIRKGRSKRLLTNNMFFVFCDLQNNRFMHWGWQTNAD